MGTKNNPGAYDCIASAHPDEAMFALLGRDRIGGSLTRLWALAREQMGEDPPKVAEAHDCAALMDAWCRSCGKTPADVLDLLPFEVLQGAVQRRGAIVARPSDFASGDVSVVASTPLSPTLVLTGKQLRIVEMLAEDDDTEVCVGFGSPDAKAGPGMYAWVQGYPEVGAVPLFDESVSLNEHVVSSPNCQGHTVNVGCELWCVNIQGPDDVIAAPSKEAAERYATEFNNFWAIRAPRKDEFDPLLNAVAIPWPHSFESHAQSLMEWTEFATPQPGAVAGPAAPA